MTHKLILYTIHHTHAHVCNIKYRHLFVGPSFVASIYLPFVLGYAFKKKNSVLTESLEKIDLVCRHDIIFVYG